MLINTHQDISEVRPATALLLTDNRTDTDWWQRAASRATAVCFTDGRISFYSAERTGSSPTTGQTFCYFGEQAGTFVTTFSEYGLCFEKSLEGWTSTTVAEGSN